jgi:hypothetical protein
VLPGPILDFTGGGLNFDWYQPLHENGNILSYPAPSDTTFAADVGTYDIPCPKDASDCNPDGTKTIEGPMVPASLQFLAATSGSIKLDYKNETGSGNTFKYQHKFAVSADVKTGLVAKTPGTVTKFSLKVGFSSEASWSSMRTSDSSTTSETGITVAHTSVSSTQAYAFYPVFYTTQDGTIKVAHAVDPLGSATGSSFWAGLYGVKADPALNLPLRFRPEYKRNMVVGWLPNLLISRKQMRGFFVMSNTPDPVSGEYVILGQAPVAGEQVRLSAIIYNYSTAVVFTNCQVTFSAVKYDRNSDTESGPRIPIGSTFVSLPPRGHTAAQVVWDTTDFGPAPAGASQEYRIYVRLNYDGAIDELYPPEDPNRTYAPGLPQGLDPGQNDEGFGYATVVAKSVASGQAPVHLYLGPQPLMVQGPSGLTATPIIEQVGAQLRLRAQVCASRSSSDLTDLLVFDGPPANGQVLAWKRLFVPDARRCDATWFDWVPSTPGQHTLTAEVIENVDDPKPGNNQATLNVEVVGG